MPATCCITPTEKDLTQSEKSDVDYIQPKKKHKSISLQTETTCQIDKQDLICDRLPGNEACRSSTSYFMFACLAFRRSEEFLAFTASDSASSAALSLAKYDAGDSRDRPAPACLFRHTTSPLTTALFQVSAWTAAPPNSTILPSMSLTTWRKCHGRLPKRVDSLTHKSKICAEATFLKGGFCHAVRHGWTGSVSWKAQRSLGSKLCWHCLGVFQAQTPSVLCLADEISSAAGRKSLTPQLEYVLKAWERSSMPVQRWSKEYEEKWKEAVHEFHNIGRWRRYKWRSG